jgi:hypothetical protein
MIQYSQIIFHYYNKIQEASADNCTMELEPGEIYTPDPRSFRHELEYRAYLHLRKEDPQFIESGHVSPAFKPQDNVVDPATSTGGSSLSAQGTEEHLGKEHSTEMPPADIQIPDIPVDTFPVNESTEHPEPAGQVPDIPVETLPEMEQPESVQAPEQIPDEQLRDTNARPRVEEQTREETVIQDDSEPEQHVVEDAQKFLERATPFASQTIRSAFTRSMKSINDVLIVS